MAQVKALLFDLGNTLFEIDIPGCSQRIYDLLDEDTDRTKFRQEFKEKNEDLETGEISKGVFINFILRQCRQDVQALDVILAWNSMLVGMPESYFGLLKELKKKYKIYLLSNINPFHIKRFKEMIVEDHGISDFDSYFNHCFYSSEIGIRKPNPDCFKFVIDQMGLPPSSVVFFDDTTMHLEAAKNVGLRTVHVERFGDLPKRLESVNR